jgi:hypothetical protein
MEDSFGLVSSGLDFADYAHPAIGQSGAYDSVEDMAALDRTLRGLEANSAEAAPQFGAPRAPPCPRFAGREFGNFLHFQSKSGQEGLSRSRSCSCLVLVPFQRTCVSESEAFRETSRGAPEPSRHRGVCEPALLLCDPPPLVLIGHAASLTPY